MGALLRLGFPLQGGGGSIELGYDTWLRASVFPQSLVRFLPRLFSVVSHSRGKEEHTSSQDSFCSLFKGSNSAQTKRNHFQRGAIFQAEFVRRRMTPYFVPGKLSAVVTALVQDASLLSHPLTE